MRYFVIDTNVLLKIVPSFSEYRYIWNDFVSDKIALCVTTEILNEYFEILTEHGNEKFASYIVDTILTLPHTKRIETYYRFGLITKDNDDNKFVDCAISSGAELIVSDDRHFNELKSIEFPKVIAMPLVEFATYYNKTRK